MRALSCNQNGLGSSPGGDAILNAIYGLNMPFPSSKKFQFQNEAKCEIFVVEMSFNYDANKAYFHNKGFALSLVLKVKLFGTRKWPIVVGSLSCSERFLSGFSGSPSPQYNRSLSLKPCSIPI